MRGVIGRRDTWFVGALVPLALVVVALTSGPSGPEAELAAAVERTLDGPVTFEAHFKPDGPYGHLIERLQGRPYAAGRIVDGAASYAPFGQPEFQELRLLWGARATSTVGIDLYMRVDPYSSLPEQDGMRPPTPDEIAAVTPDPVGAAEATGMSAVLSGSWLALELTEDPSDGPQGRRQTPIVELVESTTDGSSTYRVSNITPDAQLVLAAPGAFTGLPNVGSDVVREIVVEVSDGWVRHVHLGDELRVDVQPVDEVEPIEPPDTELAIPGGTALDRALVTRIMEALSTAHESGGAEAAFAYFDAIRAAQEQVLAQDGRYTDDVQRLEAAGFERPPLVLTRLCTFDDGAGYAAATLRFGEAGPANYIDSTDLEQPLPATRENRDIVRGAVHGCFSLGEQSEG